MLYGVTDAPRFSNLQPFAQPVEARVVNPSIANGAMDGHGQIVAVGKHAKAKCNGRVGWEKWWLRSGFLRYAAHDKTVSNFGRNDDPLVWLKENKQQQLQRQRQNAGILRLRRSQSTRTASLRMTRV
jgi:hypothetical protein